MERERQRQRERRGERSHYLFQREWGRERERAEGIGGAYLFKGQDRPLQGTP